LGRGIVTERVLDGLHGVAARRLGLLVALASEAELREVARGRVDDPIVLAQPKGELRDRRRAREEDVAPGHEPPFVDTHVEGGCYFEGPSYAMEYRFGDITIPCSNADRVVFPESGLTKGDVVAYYCDVAGEMVPELRSRPLTLERFTKGLTAGGFY